MSNDITDGMVRYSDVYDRWMMLCKRLHIPHADSNYLSVSSEYRSRYFGYHNLKHIEFCLTQMDAHRALAKDPDLVEFALWLHDYVYNTLQRPQGLPTNEALNAEHADKILRTSSASMEVRQKVCDMILVTDHIHPPMTQDEALVVDIDWSALAAPWKEYMQNRASIKGDYAHLSNAEFLAGRKKWLESARARPHQFHLTEFREKYERCARDNLEREYQLFYSTSGEPSI